MASAPHKRRSRRRRDPRHHVRWTAIGIAVGLACALFLCGRALPQPGAPNSVVYVGWSTWDNHGTQWYHWVLHRALAVFGETRFPND